MKKRYITIIGIIILVAVGIMFFIKNGSTKYTTKEITRGTITEYVEASGTIKPINTIAVGTQVSGTVAGIYVDYNSQVKKGQLLAELDPSLFQSNVEQSTAKLNNAQAAYSKAVANLEYKKNNYKRYEHLYAKNYVSRDDVELARSNYLTAQADVAAARAEMKASQATLKNNLTNLGYSKITSPVDGTVISRAVDVGQTVAASFNTPTLFEVAKDLTKMQIETSVSEADIGKIKVGQEAEYTLDGYPNKIFHGNVTQVRLASTTTNNVVTYTVIISVDNTDGFAIPGMSANVSVITGQVKDVLVVDNKALKFSPAENKQKYENQGIWILENNEPVRYDVELGLSDDNNTQIISDKIQEKDKVIIGSVTKGKKKANTNTMRRPPL
mgnify:CR=1 FL=1